MIASSVQLMEKLSTSSSSSENKTRTTEGNPRRICGVGRGEIAQSSLAKSALNDIESLLTFLTIMYYEVNALVLPKYVYLKFLSD